MRTSPRVSTRYELLECLGEGGMGRVYRAVHHPSGTTVALKMLRAEWRDDAERRRLFLDEATAAARLSDPRIVRLLDVGTDERGAPFLVMEHVDGIELEAWIEAWPGWENVMRVLLDVLEGLSAAHAAGIVHRDLKPANVIVEHDGGRARMLDFGVAALLDPLRASSTLRVAGTPEFMAPEQLLGTGPIGPWTDLYAFGVMLAYVLTGDAVFELDGDLAALAARKREPTTLGPDVAMRPGLEVPDALRRLVSRLLAPHPRQRLRFAAEVRAELLEATSLVVDRVPRQPGVARARRAGDTTVDPSFEATVLPERLLAPPRTTSESLGLPLERTERELPAPSDLSHGIALSHLREIAVVGREGEQELLESLVASVLAEGGAHLLVLEGEAGIGKSRLARWGLAEVERTGAMEGAAGGYDLGGSGAAGGLRHALERLLGAPPPRTDADAPDPALAAWQWLADASVARSSTPGLGRTSQSGDPELDRALLARLVRADASQETLAQEEIARLAHAALRALGRLRPIYLWLDDAGWSRDGALALVERLLDANDTPILVVATIRSDAPASDDAIARLERLRSHARTTRRTLEGLSDDAIAALAQDSVPLAPGVARSIAAIVPRSPMLVRAALREWVESGVLVPGPDGYAPRAGSEIERRVGVRPLELLVASRIERLLASFGDGSELAEGVLVRAALLGARLERPALEAAVGASPVLVPLLDPLLDRALVSGLLRVEQHLVVFDHGLVHEAVLARSRGDARARIDVANALQQRYGKERADVMGQVAMLLHDARLEDLAWDRLVVAIDRSAWAADDVAAQALLAIGERWLAARPEEAAAHTAHLWLARANAHYFALRYDEAVGAVQRARREASAIDDRHLALRCDALFADISFYQDRLATAQRTALGVMEQLDAEDPEHAAIAAALTHRLSDLEVLRGDLEAALEWRERCLAHNVAAQRPWRARIARLNIAELHVAAGRHGDARAIFEEVLAEARRERDDDAAAACLESQAHLDAATGEAARAREVNDPLLARLEARGDLWRLTSARMVDAIASLGLDPPDEIAARVAAFVAAYRKVPHDDAFTACGVALLARELARRGLEPPRASLEALFIDRQNQLAAGFSR